MLKSLPRGVIVLGFVSLFMDVSSEMIHSLLPVFLVTVLGASALSVGIIEGIAEATASIVKVFSGVISDWMGRRKPLVLLGYGLAALSKPLFPLATGMAPVLLARFVDRIGKGIRGAPRDALVADLTPPDSRGAAYGLRQSMDTVGAFAGPVFAVALMAASGNDFRLVFWAAVAPAFIAVALIVLFLREPAAAAPASGNGFPIQWANIARLGSAYWRVTAFALVLTLARFSEAFLLLRATNAGLGAAYVPVILIVMNVVYAASAYPAGRLADRMSKRTLLTLGVACLVTADLVLAGAKMVWLAAVGSLFWGLHMGATQGLLNTIVAETAPDDLRGTAFGLFNLVTGGATLAASILAGLLWTALGPAATFLAGAALALVGLLGLLAGGRKQLRM